MAQLLHPDGEYKVIAPADGTTFTLDELQELVGGFIQVLSLPKYGVNIILNEDGKNMGLPVNENAQEWALAAGVAPDDHLVGNVLLCFGPEFA